jgi:hypothetical protein
MIKQEVLAGLYGVEAAFDSNSLQNTLTDEDLIWSNQLHLVEWLDRLAGRSRAFRASRHTPTVMA